jgi:fatty-acyl-CoA synthase
MYHSVGGVVATGAVLTRGGSVVIRDKFSASQFWNDIVRWDCTLFQYIGELCRYLMHTSPAPSEIEHRIRMCCGNGLRIDIWDEFKTRFRIPQILEFYAATEGNFSLFNIDGKPGSIGRTPPFLAHRFPIALVKFNVEKQAPVRDENGFCIPCASDEAGEAVGKVASHLNSRFEGYTDAAASSQKILHNVFERGDSWFRTGDLLRRDAKGFFYFVDRAGDTFRWKGENVATSEVSEAICAFPGVREAIVYGVQVPLTDGRACMSALSADDPLDLVALRRHLIDRLPTYARPLFLRIRQQLETTATFKYTKMELARENYDPAAVSEPVYFNDPEIGALVPMDRSLFDRIQRGKIRL